MNNTTKPAAHLSLTVDKLTALLDLRQQRDEQANSIAKEQEKLAHLDAQISEILGLQIKACLPDGRQRRPKGTIQDPILKALRGRADGMATREIVSSTHLDRESVDRYLFSVSARKAGITRVNRGIYRLLE